MTSPAPTHRLPIAELDERYGELRYPPSEADLKAMKSSLERFGQLSPITVCSRGTVFSVVDGFKRLGAARSLSLTALDARAMSLSEAAAVAAIYSLNRSSPGLTIIEEALIVQKLCRAHGLSQLEVSRLLDKHPSWTSRRLMLIERLSEEVQADLRVGLVSSAVARELVRLPRGNQGVVAAAVHRHGLSSREAERLVSAFEAGGPDARETLLEDPRAHLDLRRARATKSDGVEDDFLGRVLRTTEAMSRLIREAEAAEPSFANHAAARSTLVAAHGAATSLVTKLGHLIEIAEVVDGANA
jgi:ParB/RepB/Spo0J family partition protein